MKYYNISFLFSVEAASADGIINLKNIPEAEIDVYTAGKHSAVMAGMPSRGIHVFWAEKVDEMLESGVMPKQVYNILHKIAKSDDERSVIPPVIRMSNRKRFIFQRKYVIDTANDLRNFLRPHRV
jgi:hypothetical protein